MTSDDAETLQRVLNAVFAPVDTSRLRAALNASFPAAAPSASASISALLPWQRPAFLAAREASRAVEGIRAAMATVTVDGGPGGKRVSMRDMFDEQDRDGADAGLVAQSTRLRTALMVLSTAHARSQIDAATRARAGRALSAALARGRMADLRSQAEDALASGWAAVAVAVVRDPAAWQSVARLLTHGTGITARWMDRAVRAAVVRAHREGLLPSPAVPTLALIDEAGRGWNEFLD